MGKEQRENELKKQFEDAAKPLIKFLNENYNPHTGVLVTTTSAELVQGEMAFNTDEFIRD